MGKYSIRNITERGRRRWKIRFILDDGHPPKGKELIIK